MNSAGKILISMLLVVIMMTFMSFKVTTSLYDKNKEDYESSVRYASQLVTMDMIDTSDVNSTYDGTTSGNTSDIPIKIESIPRFKEILMRDLKTRAASKRQVSNIEVPLVGLVNNEYIIGMTYDNKYLPPMEYSVYVSTTESISTIINNKTWRFTLGNKVYIDGVEYEFNNYNIKDKVTNSSYYTYYYINSLGFANLYQFRDYVVATTVDKYLNSYTGATFNNTANEASQKFDFNLGKINYTRDKTIYTEKSALIKGQTMFAVIDTFKGTPNNKYRFDRIAAFGGSELVTKQ